MSYFYPGVVEVIGLSTKISSLLLASLIFILNQYLFEKRRLTPSKELIWHFISMIAILSVIITFSIINLFLTHHSELEYFKGYYYIISLSPLLPSIFLIIILVTNLPTW